MFFVRSIASRVSFFFLPLTATCPCHHDKISLAEREKERGTSQSTVHVICTHYSFALDNIITKAGTWCGAEGKRRDLNKGVLREKVF